MNLDEQDDSSLAPTHNRRPMLWHMLRFVVVVPTFLSLSDKYLLEQTTRQHGLGWMYMSYWWFCIQTALVSWYVGRQLRQSRWWWAILAWTMLLIDMQVMVIANSQMSWFGQGKILSYAFASAQAGLVVAATVLGSSDWRLRLMLLFIGLGWVITFGYAMNESGMIIMLHGQCVATLFLCLLMRVYGFRLSHRAAVSAEGKLPSQFSIRHLFYWTTSAALLAAVARSIDFGDAFTFFQKSDILHAVWYTAILSTTAILATWAALGAERWPLRVAIVLIVLPAIGAVCGHLSPKFAGRSWSIFPVWFGQTESTLLWMGWCSLAGWFLAAILLVFRGDGQILDRRTRAVRA